MRPGDDDAAPNATRRRDPPRLLTRLLASALPDDPRGRSILGDLVEEWHGRPAGLRRTTWYLFEAVGLTARYLFVRRRLPGVNTGQGRGGSGGRPDWRGVIDRVHGDLRQAVRGLRHQPAFTVTSVAVLALGIGAATAVATAFQAVVLKQLPVRQPERLVQLSLHTRSGAAVTLTRDELDVLAGESRMLQGVAGVALPGAVTLPLVAAGRPVGLSMSVVTPNFFDVLGARPMLGRLLQSADGDEGAAPVTVISYQAWQREFGGDPGILGRRLTQTQTRKSYTIVGVAPPGLDEPAGVGYWLPSGPAGGWASGHTPMQAVVRLAPHASVEAARTEFLSIARALDSRRAHQRSPDVATSESLTEAIVGNSRPLLVAITVAVGLLLLIACVNVGNLLLIRTTRRSREVMVRRALGAGSGGVAQLLLMESALIGASGGALGLALAVGLLRVLPALAPDRIPRSEMIGLAGTPIAVAVTVSVVAVLIFGVIPPLVATRGNLSSALHADGRSQTGTRGHRRMRRSLVEVQVALAVVLLFGSGLVVRSLEHLDGLDLGYDVKNVAIVELSLDRQGLGHAGTFDLLDRVLERIQAAPGVTAATWIMSRPFMGAKGILEVRPRLEGQTDAEAESNPHFPVEVGGGELFRTLGIPIVRGRGLRATDRADAPKVAVVSQAVARQLWPGEDPIGRRVQMVTSRAYWWTVVGVVGDTRFRRLRDSTPTIYVPYQQLQILPAAWTVAVRTSRDPTLVLPAVRQVLKDLGGRAEVWRAGTLSDYLDSGPLAEPRMSALLLSGFGLAALLLAAIGLYGVMALAVRERTHELGVRRALGAPAHRLRWDVLNDAFAVTAAGAVVGLGVALFLSRLLAPLLFEVAPWDPATLIGVCATLLGVAALAAYLPARRATVVDPMHALRAD